jgi:hypothetical protein
MNENTGDNAVSASSEPCSVVVLYEDAFTRDQALALCARLRQQWGGEVDFDFSFWKLAFLRDALMAKAAGYAAVRADLLIFSAQYQGEWPADVKQWLETWLAARAARTGALIPLIQGAAGWEQTVSSKQTFLCELARRAKMDCLVQDLAPLVGPDAVSFDTLLQSSLQSPAFPPGPPASDTAYFQWGINE